jgi:hypothetical protein
MAYCAEVYNLGCMMIKHANAFVYKNEGVILRADDVINKGGVRTVMIIGELRKKGGKKFRKNLMM